jgi:hypothetical protein
MPMASNTSLALAATLFGAALFALLRKEPSHAAPATFEPRPAANETFDPSMFDQDEDQLPPNHPPIGGQGEPGASAVSETDEPPSLSWNAPVNWSKVPNPNAMRLATYRVAAAPGARDEPELTVVRAGGSTEANLERWIAQFENPVGIVRDKRVVHGLTIATLEVRGTFRGGGMAAAESTDRKPGWMLKGAVVETTGGPYFFKMTGPNAAVVAARAGFDALVDSITPISKSAVE